MKGLSIVAYVHLYLPKHNAGAEVMLHEILLELIKFGHKATVICGESDVSEYQGIKIINRNNRIAIYNAMKDCDVMITHLDLTRNAIMIRNKYKVPIVHIVHNDTQLLHNQVKENECDLIVANSKWISDTIKLNKPKIIVYPPIDVEKYEVYNSSAKSVTLINLFEKKGANTFWKLVELMPNQEFIGVIGGYGKQIIPKELPNNVKIIKHTPNIKEVYKQTKILLVPSVYESWGRVGMEAYSSGIPVIANPTEGLLESLSYAGIFVDEKDVEGYAKVINKLMDNIVYYEEVSKNAKSRVKEVEKEYKKQILVLNDELIKLCKK